MTVKISDWQEQLKMGGAVTTATGGTAALFNNKAMRGRKRAKKKKGRC